MLYETIKKPQTNIFTLNNRIPLGLNSFKGISKERIICLPYRQYSGAIGI